MLKTIWQLRRAVLGTTENFSDECDITMSTLGNKGEKNQGKYKAIDINNLYKGTSVTPQKPATGIVII